MKLKISRLAIGMMMPLLTVISPVNAQFATGDLQTIIAGGAVPGTGDNDEVNIKELRLERGHYFRDRLGFCTEFLIYRPTGRRNGLSVNTTALGLEFAVRWHFLKQAGYTVYVDWGMGLMAAIDPFPPNGTRFNGTPHFGLGLSARLTRVYHLLIGFRQRHMSNGKGIVPENPSFDGLGAYVGVIIKPGKYPPFPPLKDPVLFGGQKTRIRVDATISHIDDNYSPGGSAAVDFLLPGAAKIHGQIAYSAAELVDELIWEGAFCLYRETSRYRFSLGYARKEFGVFTSDFYRFQIEHILNDVCDFSFQTGLEMKNLDDDRIFGGLFITVFPVDSWKLRSGIAFERQEYGLFNSLENLSDAGFNFDIEWSPDLLARAGLSLFLQSGTAGDEHIAGLRFQPDGKRSLRERHHSGSFIPLR